MVQWIGVPPTQDLPALEQDVFQRLQSELDAACLKAATVLLDRLRLQPLDGTIGTDSGMAITRLFAKYLNFFVNAMERASLFDVCTSLIGLTPLLTKLSSPKTRQMILHLSR